MAERTVGWRVVPMVVLKAGSTVEQLVESWVAQTVEKWVGSRVDHSADC